MHSFVYADFLLDVSSTLKMEAVCSSETSVATQQTTRRQIPEDDTLQPLMSLPYQIKNE
jgi:hypothetical protein